MNKRFIKVANRVTKFLLAQRESYASLNDAAVHDDMYEAGGTEIWYAKNLGDWTLGSERPDPKNLKNTHVLLGKIKEKNTSKIYSGMQGERWSPGGEARDLIKKKGLRHTSMSVGDVIKIGNKTHFVAMYGFEEL